MDAPAVCFAEIETSGQSLPRAMERVCLSASWKCETSWWREVLEKEFPESASRVRMHVPEEKNRRKHAKHQEEI